MEEQNDQSRYAPANPLTEAVEHAKRDVPLLLEHVRRTPEWTPEYLANKAREAELIERLRRPKYVGGYDLDEPDAPQVAAAKIIEQLRADFETERTMHNAWRKRAEEAESVVSALASAAGSHDHRPEGGTATATADTTAKDTP